MSLRSYSVGVARLAWHLAARGWCASCVVRRRSAQARLVIHFRPNWSNMLGLERWNDCWSIKIHCDATATG